MADYSFLKIDILLDLKAKETMEYNKLVREGAPKEQIKEIRHAIKAMIREYESRVKWK